MPRRTTSVTAATAAPQPTSAYPLAKRGQIIGRPYTGTHTLGNWQSDNAVDISGDVGTNVIAVIDGRIGDVDSSGTGPDISSRFAGGAVYLSGQGHQVWYKHLSSIAVHSGQSVKAGDIIGKSGGGNGVAHIHFGVEPPDDPFDFLSGQVQPGTGGQGNAATTSVDLDEVESVAKAAAFSAYLELPGVMNSAESLALSGERSLMNDQPLFPFVKQICEASLRRFQSMPNGNFFGFYPDYFGGLGHRTPYWQIEDIEIIDGRIDLSDDSLATHVFVVGDTVGMWDGVTMEFDAAQTAGVVDMMRAFAADFIHGTPNAAKSGKTALMTKDEVISFLKKYGARPYLEQMPMVRSPYYEMFLAYQKFCLMWASQFQTTFVFTYMPEVYPGGIVAFPDHGIQMFVEEVEHIFDYASGFETRATLSAPAALPNSGRGDVTEGMIRAHALNLTPAP